MAVLLAALAALVLLLGATSLVVAISGVTGAAGFAVGVALALLPVPVVIGGLLWIDRFEPEPPAVLGALFLWGAVVAAFAASLVNSVALQFLQAIEGEQAYTSTAVLVAPLVEELAKGLGVVALALFARREFDGVVDGVVAGAMIGVGFAFTENVLYFGQAFLAGSMDLGLSGGLEAAGLTFVVRGVLAPFAHPLFTLCTGIGVGVAVSGRRPATRLLAPVLGYLAAVVLHGLWNLAAVGGLAGFVTSYVVLMVPLFLVVVAVVAVLRAREGRLISRRLPVYVAAGWLPSYDLAMVASLSGRRRARSWARERLGDRGESVMRDYQLSVTELAFLRDRAARRGIMPDFADREASLLSQVRRAQQVLATAHARG